MIQTLHKIALSIVFVSLIIHSSCIEEYPADQGVVILDHDFGSRLLNGYYLGDTLIINFGYIGNAPINVIDVSITRKKFRYPDDGTNDPSDSNLYFESFQANGNKNGLFQIKWYLDRSIGITPMGYNDIIQFNSSSKGTSGSMDYSFKIKEKPVN
jgi:hypothetical protein